MEKLEYIPMYTACSSEHRYRKLAEYRKNIAAIVDDKRNYNSSGNLKKMYLHDLKQYEKKISWLYEITVSAQKSSKGKNFLNSDASLLLLTEGEAFFRVLYLLMNGWIISSGDPELKPVFHRLYLEESGPNNKNIVSISLPTPLPTVLELFKMNPKIEKNIPENIRSSIVMLGLIPLGIFDPNNIASSIQFKEYHIKKGPKILGLITFLCELFDGRI
ncbi:hypothetical protein [Candidatus Lokiarchaeum ossiferum]|uniref:hypothetical protein n=1 Tax=Candidatus Lokiarchaeum ossiferum TaxID=2951803 RepID=UPI00352CB675